MRLLLRWPCFDRQHEAQAAGQQHEGLMVQALMFSYVGLHDDEAPGDSTRLDELP